MKVVIIGGVAGGMSAAARLRRLDERAEIVVIERSGHVSYANCGLPYHAGGVIGDRNALFLATPALLRDRFRLDVRTHHEAVRIDRAARTVGVVDHRTGDAYDEPYDHLVLATGAAPFRPDIPGIERARSLRTVEDVDAIVADVARGPRTAVIAGGGFIGLEMAENLTHRGLAVTIVELAPQVLAPLDPEMAGLVAAELARNGVAVRTGVALGAVGDTDVTLTDGTRLDAGVVIAAVGVRPDTALAASAGLALGPRGGVRVDEAGRTSDPAIWAVGDSVEKADAVDASALLVPLANIANRQGRRVADAIAGLATPATAAIGTAIVKVFDLTVAATGWNERRARAAGVPHAVVHTHPHAHAGYYPGAAPMALKAVYDPVTGAILGAQAVGTVGVDKRIDVLATAIRAGLPIWSLAELELAYAPPFSSAKDPVNMLGYIAENRRDGREVAIQWHEVPGRVDAGAALLDVRTEAEHADGHIPGSLLVPLDELRGRLDEVPAGEVVVYCQVGQRAHTACMVLAAHGRRPVTLDGGWRTWAAAVTPQP